MDAVDLPPAAIAASSPSPVLRGFARRSIECANGPMCRARSSALPPKPPVAMTIDRARIVVRPPPPSTTAADEGPVPIDGDRLERRLGPDASTARLDGRDQTRGELGRVDLGAGLTVALDRGRARDAQRIQPLEAGSQTVDEASLSGAIAAGNPRLHDRHGRRRPDGSAGHEHRAAGLGALLDDQRPGSGLDRAGRRTQTGHPAATDQHIDRIVERPWRLTGQAAGVRRVERVLSSSQSQSSSTPSPGPAGRCL